MAVTHGYGQGMRRRCLAIFGLLGVVLTACSSSSPHAAEPPASPSRSVASASASVAASPGPSASPSSVATPTPSATPFVSAATEAGAYAFVKAYFAELDRSYASGDVSKLAPYRTSTCSCLGFEKDIASFYGQGGRLLGEQTVIDTWYLGDHGPAFARAAIAFHTTGVTNRLPGKADTFTKSESGIFAIDLHRSADTWVISDVRYGMPKP